jgi:hypothetical protein
MKKKPEVKYWIQCQRGTQWIDWAGFKNLADAEGMFNELLLQDWRPEKEWRLIERVWFNVLKKSGDTV